MASPQDTTTSTLGELLDAFEKLSSEERQRDIDRANAYDIDTLAKFDEWVRK